MKTITILCCKREGGIFYNGFLIDWAKVENREGSYIWAAHIGEQTSSDEKDGIASYEVRVLLIFSLLFAMFLNFFFVFHFLLSMDKTQTTSTSDRAAFAK
ncbi:hypothetical protein IFM89_008654, partial [Coptis chinensis]